MHRYKICCLTYKRLADLFHQALARIDDEELDLLCLECHHGSLPDAVRSAYAQGYEMFIAGGSNLEIFRDLFDYPIVGLQPTYYDYMHAIIRAAAYGEEVGIVSYQEKPYYRFDELEQLLGVRIRHIVYSESTELPALIAASSCGAVIGTAFACDAGAAAGKTALLLYNDVDEIVDTIYEAKRFAQEIGRERNKSQFFSTVIDYSPSGILAVNAAGRVVVCNQAAEKLLGVSAQQMRGKAVQALFPQLRMESFLRQEAGEPQDIVIEYRGETIHVFRSLLAGDQQGISAVAMLSEASRQKNAEADHLRREQTHGFTAKHSFADILGESRAIRAAVRQARIYADAEANVLILGETGTGKELFAQSIHTASRRHAQRFVAVNCAAIPDSLLESELFGYTAGAFTGSLRTGKKGLFELANQGTIFLDEIGDLSPLLQMKLLRVLQEKEILRIGDDRIIPVDVRVIAASNKPQQRMLQEGFRPDLLYRLNVLRLDIPALARRGQDVCLLFRRMYERYHDDYKTAVSLSDEVLDVLQYYSWPGNVRELENVCQRFILNASHDNKQAKPAALRHLLSRCIGEDEFLRDLLQHQEAKQERSGTAQRELAEMLKYCFGYSNAQIAEKLGISRTTLWRSSRRGE